MTPDFELTFLGTGTSQGVPVIGCGCAVCRSEDPRDKRMRSGALIRTPECTFVIDTSPDFRTQCLKYDIKRLDAVVYTHAHIDHIIGFDDLRRFCEMEDRDMPIYAAADVLADLRRIFTYAFSDQTRYRTYIRPAPHVIDGPFFLGETEIIPVRLPHGKIILNGYLFKRHGRKLVAYFTDCHDVPSEAIEMVRGVDVLVLDALRHKPHPTHMNIARATEVAMEVCAHRTFFTHMCHDIPHEETQQTLPDGIFLAYDGLAVAV